MNWLWNNKTSDNFYTSNDLIITENEKLKKENEYLKEQNKKIIKENNELKEEFARMIINSVFVKIIFNNHKIHKYTW